LNNWGNAIADRARRRRGQDVDQLFAQASEKYGAAITAKPDLAEALLNWGNALLDYGATKTGEDADPVFSEAAEKYQAALEIRPDLHEFFRSGNIVLDERT
jgi:tetratricopeptide (TPR) repeat protein